MFKQLRNRFLILNLVTISVMMLIAFTSIYVITYQDVQKDTNDELHKIMNSNPKRPGKSGPMGMGDAAVQEHPMGGSGLQGNKMNDEMDESLLPERSVFFMLQTDEQWNLVSAVSKMDMDEDIYKLALQKAKSIGRDTGRFSLDGSDWIFAERPASSGHILVFLDITTKQGILKKLIFTFAAVGSVMLLALFFVSRFFANRSIMPVKEAFDKQKQFIADASHELKTPLAIINTNADVLLANPEDSIQSQSKWLHYIKSETERMTKLTNDLLYLTEMDDSRTGMIFAKFNLSEAVESVILTMEAVIFEKQIALDYHIEPDLMAFGNSEQIKQVVMILLDNAVKYVNPQGSITLTLKKQHNEAVLTVSNTGEGIAVEHLTRIFDRFYRTDKSRARKQGGYGLGLAIAKSIVEQHKGKIYAKSTAGESTAFYVHLS